MGLLPCPLPFNLDLVVACSAFGVEPGVTCQVDGFPSQDRGLREVEDSAGPGPELAGWQTAASMPVEWGSLGRRLALHVLILDSKSSVANRNAGACLQERCWQLSAVQLWGKS